MTPITHVALIGLGAIGGAYAAKLYEMEPRAISVVMDPERIARRANRIVVNGKGYDFPYISTGAGSPPVDLVLIAVKHHQLAQAVAAAVPLVGPDTVIISLLNGISSEEILARKFGANRVLYAMCVGIDAIRHGREVTFSHIGRICFGERYNRVKSPNVQRVQALFDRAEIPYEVPEDMLRTLWWKFMINVGVNQTSAVLNASYGVFQTVPEAQSLMEQAMQEVVDLSQKAGIGLSREDIERFRPVLHQLAPTGKTSMLQDMEAGRKTEVEFLAGKVIELGDQYGLATPVNYVLWQMIRAMETIHGVSAETYY